MSREFMGFLCACTVAVRWSRWSLAWAVFSACLPGPAEANPLYSSCRELFSYPGFLNPRCSLAQ
jgi:hypothetical protein